MRFIALTVLMVSGVGCGSRAPDTAEKLIGPEGGTISSSDGRLTLEFPAGALDKPTAISIAALTSYDASNFLRASAYEFRPDGSKFAKPVRALLRYEVGDVPAGVAERDLTWLKLVDGRWQTLPGSVVDVNEHSARANLLGFSSYGVGRSTATLTVPPERIVGYWGLTLPKTQCFPPPDLSTVEAAMKDTRCIGVSAQPGQTAMSCSIACPEVALYLHRDGWGTLDTQADVFRVERTCDAGEPPKCQDKMDLGTHAIGRHYLRWATEATIGDTDFFLMMRAAYPFECEVSTTTEIPQLGCPDVGLGPIHVALSASNPDRAWFTLGNQVKLTPKHEPFQGGDPGGGRTPPELHREQLGQRIPQGHLRGQGAARSSPTSRQIADRRPAQRAAPSRTPPAK